MDSAGLFRIPNSALRGIFSALLSGYLISKKEKNRIGIEQKIENINKKIIAGRNHQSLAAQKNTAADLFLLIMQSTSPQKSNIWAHMANVIKNIIDGLCDRYMAVHHKVPDEAAIKHWNDLASRILDDKNALEQLKKIERELLEACVSKEKELFEQKKVVSTQKSMLEFKIEKNRYTSITFQILGLIVVLIKDLFSKQ